MGARPPEHEAQPSEHISSLINEFFDRRRAGEELTPERFLAEHPQVAEQLRPHLAGLSLYEKACALIGDAVEQARSTAAELPTVEGYNLIEEIGRGGMGVVYRALQLSTKRVVALKVMLAGAFASPSARRRFEREVELAARLQHASIVRILESGDVAGQRYYAMDYVPGTRLDRYFAASQPDLRSTLGLFVQICEAVDYAHTHGVVHRDLKPANVVIDDEGNPHVLDFGLAKATDEAGTEETLTAYVSLPGQVVGTLFYLSPEQAAGAPDEIDARTDVYALGVMLFEALTGSLPFDTTGRLSEVIRRILETTPTPPRSLSDRVDDDLETIILKTLEKEKARRYQSARELAEDVRRYLAGDPILAKRPSSLYFLRKKVRKHRLGVALCVAAGATALIALSVESWLAHRELAGARWTAWWWQNALEEAASASDGTLGPARALYERFPELPEAVLVWAQAQYRSGQQDDAVRFVELKLRVDPSCWARRALLAEMYRAAGDTERADVLAAQAERDVPDTAEAWYLRSFATLDLQRALWCAQQAVQRRPSRALAWARLTCLRAHTGDLEGALRGADEILALEEKPRRRVPFVGGGIGDWTLFKGRVLSRQGRFREAIEHFTRAGVYLDRAHTYRRLREYEKAVADYTRMLKAEGETTASVWHFYQRATPLWILGRTDEALADYRRVRILLGKPFYSDARAFLILRELDRQEEAEELLAAALREVKNPSWLRQILRCLALEITPDNLVADGEARNNLEQLCEAYYYAGEVCLLSGRQAEARSYFEQCVQTGVEFDPDAMLGTPMNEYELAQWRLDTVCAESPATPTSRESDEKN